ncbi:PifC [Klebsiella quasivariicola]|nr:PifC [Klebsiella quasivariicola]
MPEGFIGIDGGEIFLLAEAFETLIREFTAGCAEGTLAEALAGLHCMYEDL